VKSNETARVTKTTAASRVSRKATAPAASSPAVKAATAPAKGSAQSKGASSSRPATQSSAEETVAKAPRKKTPSGINVVAKPVTTAQVEVSASSLQPSRAPARARKTLRPTLPGPGGARPANSPFRNFMQYEPRADEPYMSKEQLSHFRSILLRWRQELMEEVDRTVHHMRDEAANFPDPADRATQEEEFSIELRTRDRERKLIKKIDQTIERLDAGDFGYCDTCGVEIGLRRLEARPTATQCVDCKALDEIKERQLHG
jgi:DnaK suppressor protein